MVIRFRDAYAGATNRPGGKNMSSSSRTNTLVDVGPNGKCYVTASRLRWSRKEEE